MRRILGGTAGIWMLAGAAHAHPHIFVDTGLHPVFDDQGLLAAIRVVWSYDEMFSLLILEDKGLDPDYDGVLTEAETQALNGFDMQWIDGYEGDVYGLLGGVVLGLSGPLEHTADMVDGRIVSTHLRALDKRIDVGGQPVIFQAYDPTFYTAYHITLPTRIEGRDGCSAKVFLPNLDEANQILLDAISEVGADENIEDYDFPAVGADFAEEIRLTCAPLSQ